MYLSVGRNVDRSARAIRDLQQSTREARNALQFCQDMLRFANRPTTQSIDRLETEVANLDDFAARRWSSAMEYLVNNGPPSLSNSSLETMETCCSALKSIHEKFNLKGGLGKRTLYRFGAGLPSKQQVVNWTETIQAGTELLWQENPTIRDDLVVQKSIEAEEAYQVYQSTQILSDLEAACTKTREALSIAPMDHRDRGSLLNNLAIWTNEQVRATDPRNKEKLLKALHYSIDSVNATRNGDTRWTTHRYNLRDLLNSWTDLHYFEENKLKTKTGPCEVNVASLYHTLPSASIRLLSPVPGEPLKFTLAQYQANVAPPYVALSYTWILDDYFTESGDTQHSITVNGQEFYIHENLHDALTYVLPDVRELKCLLWVDSVCINQSDLAERTNQVALMGDIFQDAQEVFAWLGLPLFARETEFAVAFIETVAEEYLEKLQQDSGQASNLARTAEKGSDDYFPRQGKPGVIAAWEGLSHLFSRALWNRTWIVQELTTQRPTTCYCGDFSFELIRVDPIVDRTLLYQEKPGFDASLWERLGSTSPLRRLLNIKAQRRDTKNGLEMPLISVMRMIRPSRCEDPRDKVYAALGLTTDAVKGQIIQDYTVDTAIIYTQVARWAMHNGYGLAFLGLVTSTTRDKLTDLALPDLPSWVPDWRYDNLLPLGPLRGDWTPSNQTRPLYNPCPQQRVKFDIVDNELHVPGIVFDKIRYITERQGTGQRSKDAKSMRKLFLQDWKPMLRAAGAQFTDAAFDRMIVADSYAKLIDNNWVDHRGARFDWSLLDESRVQGDQHRTKRRKAQLDTTHQSCLHREAGITTTGGHLALLPGNAKEGDVIAALNGGPCLYVLRQRNNSQQYRLVGECYVDEMMDGQVLSLGKATQEIVIV